jgi:Polyketide cyclase / dehydrase and lipid transport
MALFGNFGEANTCVLQLLRVRSSAVIDVSAVELSFADVAPVRVVEVLTIPARPGQVFEALNSPEAWWRGARGVKWLTPAPHGVGSVRNISPARGLRLEETFVAWQPGILWACTITKASLPLFARYLIRVDIEPAGPETSTLRWTSAVAPGWLGRLAGPLFARIVRHTIRFGLAGLPGHFRNAA